MIRAATIFLIIVFLGSSFFCLALGTTATGLPEEEIRSTVRQLIDSNYERLRSRMQYTDDPADACWLIEKKSDGSR